MNTMIHYGEAARFTPGGIWDCSTKEACEANFPALKHFFPCKEKAGAVTLTDIKGGVVLSGITSISNEAGIISTTGTFNAVSPNWPAPAVPTNVKILIIYSGAASAETRLFSMGAAANAGNTVNAYIRLANGTTATALTVAGIDGGVASIAVNGANNLAGNSTLQSHALWIDVASASGLVQHSFDGTTLDPNGAKTAVDITTMAAGISAFTPGTAPMSSLAKPGLIQVWHFYIDIPTDLERNAALVWTHAQVANNFTALADDVGGFQTAKYAYPGFRGKI